MSFHVPDIVDDLEPRYNEERGQVKRNGIHQNNNSVSSKVTSSLVTSKGLISSEGAHTDQYESRLNRGTAITDTDRSSSVGDDMPSH